MLFSESTHISKTWQYPWSTEKVEINSTACNSRLNGAPMTRVALQTNTVEKTYFQGYANIANFVLFVVVVIT